MRHWRPGDEEAICRVISTCYSEEWEPGSVSHWRWKHLRRPGFTAEDVLVALSGKQVVGCFHGWLLPFRLEEDLSVPVSFNGDWALLPEFRGGALTTLAWDRAGKRQREKGALLRVGFATPEVNESVYRRRFGSVFVPASTIRYRKPIGLEPLREKLREFGTRALGRPRISNILGLRPWTVDFNLDRLPPFHVIFDPIGFHLKEGAAAEPDLQVEGPSFLLARVPDGAGRLLAGAFGQLLRGRLRVRGILRSGRVLVPLLLANLFRQAPGHSGHGF